MTASSVSVQQTARLAIAISIIALGGLVFIALFFGLGGRFGTLNDACVGFEGF